MTPAEVGAVLGGLEAVKQRLTFTDENHTYTLDGSLTLPSVTQIIKPLSDKVYGSINEGILAVAAERGTAVHNAIELYERYGWATDDEGIAGYIESYAKWRKSFPEKIPFCNEFMIYSPSNLYAGRGDFLSSDSGLWDIKTTADAHIGLWGVQLAGYDAAIRELKLFTPNYGGILQLHADGSDATPFIYSQTDLKKHYVDFLCCLKIWQFKD